MVDRWHPTSDSIMLIAKHPGGDYVRHSDYAALEAQLSEARAAWIPITSDGGRMTCPLPADESIIDVMMPNGDVKRAWFSCNIMDAGDWDILPANENGEPDTDADSLNDAIAWRSISALGATPPAPKVTEAQAELIRRVVMPMVGERSREVGDAWDNAYHVLYTLTAAQESGE